MDDFEAVIRIFTPEEGGRRSPPANGIRWDFAYVDESPDVLYMIWPDFIAADGSSLPSDPLLPINVELTARMTIVNDAGRTAVHRGRIAPGLKFYCHEGPRRVAEGVVTRITGLFAPRE